MFAEFGLIVRTLLVLLALLLVSRLLGRRTLSELTFYDFVIGLVLGHIGGSVITDGNFTVREGLTALTVATLWLLAINLLALKSIPARKLIEAEPLMVIHKGRILENNLKKRYYNINDLLEMLREQGTFDPDQVEVALIEADGQLSVLNKAEYQTPSVKDITGAAPVRTPASGLAGTEIIIDGTLQEQGLAQSGLTREQLKAELAALGIADWRHVTLALRTPEGKLYIDTRRDAT